MYRYLGYLCDGHPLQFYSKRTRGIRHITPAARLHEAVGRKVSVVGWPVTRKTVLTSGGQPMQFVSFEDESAIYETVLFPDAFDKYGDTVAELRPFIIQGKVESEQGATYVQVDRVRKIPAPDPP